MSLREMKDQLKEHLHSILEYDDNEDMEEVQKIIKMMKQLLKGIKNNCQHEQLAENSLNRCAFCGVIFIPKLE